MPRSYSEHFIFFLTYEWANKLECLSLASLSNTVYVNTYVFTTFPFLHKLWKDSISEIVCSWQGFPVCCIITIKHIGPICTTQRKWSDSNLAQGIIFTTLQFLCNLLKGPIGLNWLGTLSCSSRGWNTLSWQFFPAWCIIILKHFCKFISYKEKKFCEFGPRDHIHKTSFSLYLINGPNKLECLYPAGLSSIV